MRKIHREVSRGEKGFCTCGGESREGGGEKIRVAMLVKNTNLWGIRSGSVNGYRSGGEIFNALS